MKNLTSSNQKASFRSNTRLAQLKSGFSLMNNNRFLMLFVIALFNSIVFYSQSGNLSKQDYINSYGYNSKSKIKIAFDMETYAEYAARTSQCTEESLTITSIGGWGISRSDLNNSSAPSFCLNIGLSAPDVNDTYNTTLTPETDISFNNNTYSDAQIRSLVQKTISIISHPDYAPNNASNLGLTNDFYRSIQSVVWHWTNNSNISNNYDWVGSNGQTYDADDLKTWVTNGTLQEANSYWLVPTNNSNQPEVLLNTNPYVDCCTKTGNPSELDSDGDNIIDSCDLDDDNDGILDTDEAGTCSSGNNNIRIADNFGENSDLGSNDDGSGYLTTLNGLTYSVIVIEPTDAEVKTRNLDGNGEQGQVFKFSGDSNERSSLKINFNNPIYGANFKITDLDENETVTVTVEDENGTSLSLSGSSFISSTGSQVIQSGNVFSTINSPVNVSGDDISSDGVGSVLFDFTGQAITSVKVRVDHVRGSSIRFTQISGFCDGNTSDIDTDNDGIIDRLDTDSDNDGCPDATEGDDNLTTTATLNGGSNGGSSANLGTSVNSNGIPNSANTGSGQNNNSSVVTAEQITVTGITNKTFTEGDDESIIVSASAITTTSFNAGVPDYNSGINSTGSISYKWYKNSAPNSTLSTSNTLSLTDLENSDAGDYSVEIKGSHNGCGTIETFSITINPLCTNADNKTSNASITESETKTLSGSPVGGTWSIVSGGGLINGTTYIPADVNANTNVTLRYSIDADGSCPATTDDVTFTVTSLNCDRTSPTDPALDFNIFTLNSLNLETNETEGSIATGGDLTILGNYQVAIHNVGNFEVDSTPIGLLVGGKINYQSGNTIQVSQNSYVKIGDSQGSTVWYTDQNNAYSNIRITPSTNYNSSPRIELQTNANNLNVSATNNPVFESNLIDFSNAFQQLQSNSTELSQNAHNAQITNANGQSISNTNLPNQVKINLQDGINYLNVTSTDLNNVDIFTYNNAPSATKVLVININAPGTFNWDVWNQSGVAQQNAPYVIYNFYNTATLNIQGNSTIEGTILAPFADINKTVNQSNIEGQVIGKSFYHAGGEVHSANFTPALINCAQVVCETADNTTSTASITEDETKTLTGAPVGGSWSIVSGGGSISGNTYTPTNINTNTDVTIRYTIAADGSCGQTTDEITFTVTPVCLTADNTTSNATINEGETKTLVGSPVGGTWSIVSGGGSIIGNVYTPSNSLNNDTDVVIKYTISADGSCTETSDNVSFKVRSFPNVTVSNTNVTCYGSDDGSITFTFIDNSGRTHIEFSLNGNINANYLSQVTDTSGNITYSNLQPGTYDIWTRWGNDDYPQDLGSVTITEPAQVVSNISTTGSSINEGQNKQFNATPSGGTWSVVSGSGSIDNNGLYTPVDINSNTNVTVRYTVGCANSTDDITFTVTPICIAANNTTSTASITEGDTKTLTGTPAGGTWSIVAGGGNISGTTYTPADINTNTDVTIRYTIAADGDCAATTSDVTFTVTPVCNVVANNTTVTTSISETETKTLSGSPLGGTWSIISGGGSISGITYTPDNINTNTPVEIRYTIAADGDCVATTSDVTFTVTPVCNTATNTTATASITDLETKTLTATPAGGTWSMVSMGGTITGNVFTPDSVNADTDVTIRYTIAADGDCAISTADVTFTVTPGIDPCTVGATVGVVTANDPDADGINNECDLDDDNDGILDTEECEVVIAETPFSVTGGNSVNFTLNPVGNGFVLDITKMDNSFNLTINGTPLTTQEIQFQQNGTTTGQNIRFAADQHVWGQNSIPQIYQFGNSINQNTPIVRFVVDENLDVKMYASKVANGPLFELELFNGNAFNAFTWNTNTPNNFVLSQEVAGPTYIQGRVYGTVMNCDIDDDGIRNSDDLDSDGDGCYDVVESGGVDANNDGILDGNGIDSEGRITNGSSGYDGLHGNEWVAHQMNITSTPNNLTKSDGDTAMFSVSASAEEATLYNAGSPVYGTPGNANGGLIYKWYLGDPSNGGNILTDNLIYSGTDTADLNIGDVTGLGGNVYYVVVTHSDNICAEEVSSASLSVEVLGSIGDTVWYDTNEDGSNVGENGLEGATVTLDPGTPNNPNDDLTTTTDANGEYLFDNLPSGPYTVTVDVSTVTGGLPSGKTPADLIQTYDDDSVGTANNSTINLAQGENNLDQDFGYVASDGLGSIGDTVWFDTDGDGIKDNNENGLEGATVTLDPGTPGNPNDDVVMVTDANGNYLFTDLPSGPYTISVDVSTVTGGLPNNVTVADLIQTFDYDSVGTPNNSTINLSQGENNLDQDFAYGITSGNTGGGNSGGVESESLGDAISKIYVGRKKNSVPTEFVKSSENLYNKKKMKSVQPYQGKGQTLLDMFPEELYAGNVANVTSPTDILDYTVADEVLSVDFSVNGKTKGVVLGIKTTDKIYNHTKASCDRLRGAEILNIQKIEIQGYNFLMQGIKQRNGIVEYAISFATAKNNNDNNYTIQTNWYVNEYTKFNDVYNFQVWSTKPDDTKKLVNDVLNNLKSFIPVQQTETQKFPETYASKIYREKGELIVALRSTEEGNTADISMVELYSETANNIKFRNNSVSTEIQQSLRLDIADGYEYDGLIKVDGDVEDAFYHADGNWGLDYDKTYTEIKNYFVWNDFDREYQDDEYTINRSVELKATSDYDYITVYKSLLPGTISADYSEYNYLSFTAKGSGLMELGLIKSSIEDWKAQYRVMVDFSEEEQTYYVPFDIFESSVTQEKMTADDLTTLIFTFLPVEANTTELDLEISDVKFTKTAVEDQIVSKIETFENEFMAYPNPSKGNVNLLLFSETDTEATVTLTDITGKIIYKGKTQLNAGKNELDYNFRVKTGVMLLQVTSPEADYGTSKIIFR